MKRPRIAGLFCFRGVVRETSFIHTLGVTPAQAGAHPEMVDLPQGARTFALPLGGTTTISGWTPACAGVTPWVGALLPYFMKLTRLSWLIMEVAW